MIQLSKKSENTSMQRSLYDRCICLLNFTRNGNILLQRKLTRKSFCLFRYNRVTKNSFLHTLSWGSVSYNWNAKTFWQQDALTLWLRDVHENQYAWNVIKMKNKFALLITFLRHFLWEIKILRQYMKITHGNFCFWQHLATFCGISVLKKWKKRVSIVKIKKFSPLQNT